MKRLAAALILVSICLAGVALCQERRVAARTPELERVFGTERVTIVITDSGLGGLSIAADAVRRMESEKIFAKADIVFYNALFSAESGYNSLPDRREKIRIFDRALRGIENCCHPDVIVIGCNTLSTIYGETEFAKRAHIPVIGIVEAGADLIARNLAAVPGSRAIIFGTQTTIEEGSHAAKLAAAGIPGERIVVQACPDLTEYIERGYDSEDTGMLIDAYVDEALEKLGKPPGVFFASLNCTHYGYSMKLWEDAFAALGTSPAAILNPNEELLDVLFPPRLRGRYEKSTVTVKVVSKVKIERDRLESLAGPIRRISPKTADALMGYEVREGLFNVD
jgi:glutamate racemase